MNRRYKRGHFRAELWTSTQLVIRNRSELLHVQFPRALCFQYGVHCGVGFSGNFLLSTANRLIVICLPDEGFGNSLPRIR